MGPVSVTSAATTQNAQATNTSKNTTLTQQDFLQLFTKQLQYQDPLKPMDSTQMLAQMAQINTVAALSTMTQSIQNMEAYQASARSLQAIGLIGKKVEAKGNSLSIDGQGKVSEGSYQLAKAGKVYIQIFDANGNVIRVLNEGVKDSSKQTFTWDGKNLQAARLPAGDYTFSVSAVDANNQPIQVATSRIATVTGISFENGIAYLNMGSDKVTIRDIIAIMA
jgi:flagellar basal-body rod modification protein FlgD